MEESNGLIIRSSGGFYYVERPDGSVIECRAKGIFRKMKLTPVVGDRVAVEFGPDLKGTVVQVHERKNSFTRPPVANADRLIIIASAASPDPNLFIIDKLTALATLRNVRPYVVFTKCDLADASGLTDIYNRSGIVSFFVSVVTGENIDSFKDLIASGYSVLTGNTGVGKSSLLNACDPSLKLATDEISSALGRGRHTTRTVEMFKVLGGRVTDTPGFSSLDGRAGEIIRKENLQYCFPEFGSFSGDCLFPDCAHYNDKACAVRRAAETGMIPRQRYDSYRQMLEEVKDLPDWKK